ncbi:MAG: type II toxin-antitoxin system VapC family toxin [Gemmatimonadales bacterium]
MVIDTSAVIAILLGEPEANGIIDAIEKDAIRLIGAPSLVEAGAVMLAKKGAGGVVALDALIQRLDITVEPFSSSAADFARSAYARFGKGVGSPAVLNYGDCLSYGVAQTLGQPLLFKGDDFPQTDVPPVTY